MRDSDGDRFDKLEKQLSKIQGELAKLTAPKPDVSPESVTRPTVAPDSWLKRHSHWWPLPALIIAVIALLFGPGLVAKLFSLVFNDYFDERLKGSDSSLVVNNHIDKKLDQPIKDIHKIQTDVEKIGLRLDLQEKASLKPQAFKRTLPDFSDTLKKAAEVGVQTSSDVRSAIQRNFQSVENTSAGYWPAVSQFISYSSEQKATQEVRNLLGRKLPRCFDLKPEAVYVNSKDGGVTFVPWEDAKGGRFPPSMHEALLGGLAWRNCLVDLDDKRPSGINMSAASDPGFFQFLDCLVRYRGGPITQIPAGVTFQNCIFAFALSTSPPKAGEKLSQTILASLASDTIKITKLE